MRLPHCIYQLSSGGTEACSIAIICLCVCMHTHSPATDDTTEQIFPGRTDNLPPNRKKSTVRVKACLFCNPISENGFCDFGIIHSNS